MLKSIPVQVISTSRHLNDVITMFHVNLIRLVPQCHSADITFFFFEKCFIAKEQQARGYKGFVQPSSDNEGGLLKLK